jgi:hypothetical protein
VRIEEGRKEERGEITRSIWNLVFEVQGRERSEGGTGMGMVMVSAILLVYYHSVREESN